MLILNLKSVYNLDDHISRYGPKTSKKYKKTCFLQKIDFHENFTQIMIKPSKTIYILNQLVEIYKTRPNLTCLCQTRFFGIFDPKGGVSQKKVKKSSLSKICRVWSHFVDLDELIQNIYGFTRFDHNLSEIFMKNHFLEKRVFF